MASLVMLIAFLIWPIQWPLQLKLFLIVISAMFVWMADHLTNGLGAEEAFIDLDAKTAKIGTRLDAMEPIIDRSVKILSENLTHFTLKTAHNLKSLEVAVHAAAPCPVAVKQAMIEWWGPIIHEYYGATEGLGFAACNSEEWLAHPGTAGKIVLGELAVLDENNQPVANGTSGTLWFKTATEFAYHNDPEKTREATSADGSMTTVGDVGFVDDDGFLYLTDRKTFMIISGGVNIYPQECEDLLISHPWVADAAVFGVPNVDLGEEVKAVVQLMPGID